MASLSNPRFTPSLDQARKEMEEAPWKNRLGEFERLFTEARTFLLLRHHFFGRLAMRLRYVFTERVPTMAVTADLYCYINPFFFEKLNVGERAFLLAHEISHIGYLHFHRMGNRNPDLWNTATDYMINSMLIEAGLPMPVLDDRWKDHPDYDRLVEQAKQAGHKFFGLYNKKYKNLTDVQIYDELWEDMKKQMKAGMLVQSCPTCGQHGMPSPSSGQSASNSGQQGRQPDQQNDGAGDSQQSQEKRRGSNRSKARQSGHADNGQDQRQAGSSGNAQMQGPDSSAQQQNGGAGGSRADTCPTCGRSVNGQQIGQGGWGTMKGDMDLGATRELSQNRDPEKGGRVMTPGQVRDMLIAAAMNASRAQSRGSIPAAFQRWIAELRDPKLPWNHILERWVSSVLVSGQSYRRPSRSSASLVKAAKMRGLAQGVRPILPGPKPDLQPVIIGVDVSGSRSEEDLRDDLSEVFAVLERYHNPVRVIVWDAAVHFDAYVQSVDEIELRGGGGTATEPMFEAIEKDPGHYGPPAALICFTDGMASYPEEPPPYPVLWVWTGEGDIPMRPPFGEVITIQDHGLLDYSLGASSHGSEQVFVPSLRKSRSR